MPPLTAEQKTNADALAALESIATAAAGRGLTRSQEEDFQTHAATINSALAGELDEHVRAVKAALGALDGGQAHEFVVAARRAFGVKAAASRQVRVDLDGSPSDDDLPPGAVRAYKSGEKIGRTPCPISLDQYVKAALAGDPSRLPEGYKALTTDALGSLVLPSPLAERVIDLTRAASRVIQAGALTIPLEDGRQTIARLVTEPMASWKTESAKIGESTPAFEPVEVHARTCAAMVKLSVELSDDVKSIGTAIETALTGALGVALDSAALLGSGTPPEPRGLAHTPDVGVLVTDAGLPASYRDFSRAIEGIRGWNFEPTACIYGHDVAGYLERLSDKQDQPIRPPESFAALKKFVTSKLAGLGVIGQWDQLAIAVRQQVLIEASRLASDDSGDGFASFDVLVRGTLRADVVVFKPRAFGFVTAIPQGS